MDNMFNENIGEYYLNLITNSNYDELDVPDTDSPDLPENVYDVYRSEQSNKKTAEEVKKLHFWKFNEGKVLKTIEDYIKTTYEQHYNDKGKNIQTLEKLRTDRVSGFLVGNIQKYLDRYDKKGTPKSDLLKAAHYMVLLLNQENIYD